MISSALFLAQGSTGQPQGNPLMAIVPFVLMFVIFYFIAIRPQRKKQQELQSQISALKGGDSIVTTGGIYGIISSLQEKTLTLKIADNVKIKIDKSAVAGVIKKSADADVIEVPAEDEKA